MTLGGSGDTHRPFFHPIYNIGLFFIACVLMSVDGVPKASCLCPAVGWPIFPIAFLFRDGVLIDPP